MKTSAYYSILALGVFLFPGAASAFPEMTRHGYANCITCHISPDGGGVLSAYGRSLSREALSTWGAEGEERFAYVFTTPEWLHLGGDVRGVQMFQKSSTVDRAASILMQADIEAAASIEKWHAVVSVGRQDAGSYNKSGPSIMSRRHYVKYTPTDTLSFRAGRFMLPYGINLPDHFVGIKRGLRWDEGAESYNLEAAYLGENFDAFITGTIGRPDDLTWNRDKGVAVRGSTFLNERYKIGASYFYGSNPIGTRHAAGPYAILGFTKEWFLLAEVDFQHVSPTAGSARDGMISYLRLDHELLKGLHLYGVNEFGKMDFSKSSTDIHQFGLGVQWFPRPHLELNASWQRQKVSGGLPGEYGSFGYILLHLYL